MALSLRLGEFSLPDWRPAELSWIRARHASLGAVASRAEKPSSRFNSKSIELQRAAQRGGAAAVMPLLTDRLSIRVCANLWADVDSPSFRRDCPPTQELLDRFETVGLPLSSLTLAALLRAYFDHFDRLFQGDMLKHGQTFLRRHLNARRGGQSGSDLDKVRSAQDWLFSESAIQATVSSTRQRYSDLEEAWRAWGLRAYRAGRFAQRCQAIFYIEHLEQIDVGADTAVFAEVTQKSVARLPYGEGKTIGVKVLEVLIDRSADSQLSDAWREAILEIAGDPRLPPSAPSYQRWWDPVGPERVRRMQGWMSQLDIGLFLEVLEEVGKQSSNAELQRMFPARKQLLTAILETGAVVNSRLFLSREALSYVKRQYPERQLNVFGKLSDASKSVIYMQVGSVHLVEGTHSFRIYIYPSLPADCIVFQHDKHPINPLDLGPDLERSLYDPGTPKSQYRHFASTHYTNLKWVYEAIRVLRNAGVRVDETQVLSASQLARFRRETTAPSAQPKRRLQTPKAPFRDDGSTIVSIRQTLEAAASPLYATEISEKTGIRIVKVERAMFSRPDLFKRNLANKWRLK